MVTIPFLKNNLLSIDIGFRNIKIVEVEVSRSNEVFIKNFGIASTPKGLLKMVLFRTFELLLKK